MREFFNRMRRVASLIIICLAAMQTRADVNLDGKWRGQLDLGQAKLTLVVNFSDMASDNPLCTLDSPDQNAFGMPAEILYAKNDSVSIMIKSLGLTIRGHVYEDSIRGKFRQGFTSKRIVLRRQQPPKATAEVSTYETRELTFTNPTDGVTLSGTFALPEGYAEGQTVPTVVLVSGSGQQNRDEELFGHRPFATIADYLARHGIASFRYDDRGVGKSGGDPLETTLQSNLADALAAIDCVRRQAEVASVGLIGHSEGGLIGYMAAATDRAPEFVISLAGPAVKGDSVIVTQVRRSFDQAGAPKETAEAYCRVYRRLMSQPERWTDEDLARALEPESEEIARQFEPNFKAMIAGDMKWLRSFVTYDPAEALAAARVPILLLLGELDTQVDATINRAAFDEHINPALGKSEILPGHNHLFQECVTGAIGEYGNDTPTPSGTLLSTIAQWINNRYKANQ